MAMSEVFKFPNSRTGFLAYASLGFFGALAALLVGTTFPSLIPSSAAGVRL